MSIYFQTILDFSNLINQVNTMIFQKYILKQNVTKMKIKLNCNNYK